jgi:hypothetical protein
MLEYIHAFVVLKDFLCTNIYHFYYHRSDHKYEVPTGHASFWNHIVDSVDFTEDKLKLPKVTNAHVDTLYKNKIPIKRCVCSNVIHKYLIKLI